MEGMQPVILNESQHSQEYPSENSLPDESLQANWDAVLSLYPNWAQLQSHNQAGISSEVVPIHANSNDSVLERNNFGLDENTLRKRQADQRYRERCKIQKMQMQSDMENLKEENDSLKEEIESLKKNNSLMNHQAKEIDWLRSELLQLKREHEKDKVLVQTLAGLIADPVSVEIKKLKDENATLKNAILNGNLPRLAEELAKLRTENKVLKVQNDALCGNMISLTTTRNEPEQLAKNASI